MQALALTVLLTALPGLAWAACDTADPFDCLVTAYGESHNHSGTPVTWELIDGAPVGDEELGCAHSYRTPQQVCAAAKANGADWWSISHHDSALHLDGAASGAVWTWATAANDTWVERVIAGGIYAVGSVERSTSGYKNPDGTTTTEMIESLCKWGATENTADFVCLCGIELTRSTYADTALCGMDGDADVDTNDYPSGAEDCGGHKTSICPGIPDEACTNRTNPGQCPAEFDFYKWAHRNNCTTAAAHPVGSIPTDIYNSNTLTRPGGKHPTLQNGFENGLVEVYSAGALTVGGVDIGSYGYDVFTNLKRTMPLGASDTHYRPGVVEAGGAVDLTGPCDSQTGDAFAAAHSKTGLWVNALGDGQEIVSAVRAARGFVVRGGSGSPWLKVYGRDEVDGARGVPMGGLLISTDEDIEIEVQLGGDAITSTHMEVWHEGAVVDSLTCATPCSIKALISSTDPGVVSVAGMWLARVRNSTTGVVMSAPFEVQIVP